LNKQVVGIGNTSGKGYRQIQTFGLTALRARQVEAPLIKECYVNFEVVWSIRLW